MKAKELFDKIRRQELWESYPQNICPRADSAFHERMALNAEIMKELGKLKSPFKYGGRRWALTADRMNYCEIRVDTLCPLYPSYERGKSAGLIYQYGAKP